MQHTDEKLGGKIGIGPTVSTSRITVYANTWNKASKIRKSSNL